MRQRIFRKRTRSNETLELASLRHGQIVWGQNGGPERQELIYDLESRALLSPEQFLARKKERRAQNRNRFGTRSREHGVKHDRGSFVH